MTQHTFSRYLLITHLCQQNRCAGSASSYGPTRTRAVSLPASPAPDAVTPCLPVPVAPPDLTAPLLSLRRLSSAQQSLCLKRPCNTPYSTQIKAEALTVASKVPTPSPVLPPTLASRMATYALTQGLSPCLGLSQVSQALSLPSSPCSLHANFLSTLHREPLSCFIVL